MKDKYPFWHPLYVPPTKKPIVVKKSVNKYLNKLEMVGKEKHE